MEGPRAGQPSMRSVRSGLAILAGYVAALVFVFTYHAIHAAMFGTGAPGTVGALVGLGFGVLSAIIGGWVTARLAPSAPMAHAWGLVALSLTIGIVFLFIIPPELPEGITPEPLWVQIGNLLVVLIGVPIGARWQIGRSAGTAVAS